jgi:hypothetical protein
MTQTVTYDRKNNSIRGFNRSNAGKDSDDEDEVNTI